MKYEKTVFMTGAAGHMGYEGLKLLAENKSVKLKLLSLGDRKSRTILAPYKAYENVEIIEGDLTHYDDVLRGIRGSDYVLHVGAIIPPAADHFPDLAERVNFGGTLNIIRAIGEQDNSDRIKLVYISTVASMGDRMPPIHWVRTGDPIKVSRFDYYGASKVKAERAVMESGLPFWVVLRQSGMLHRDLLKIMDPIMFHQPLNNHMEWSSADDSGRILNNICTMDLPDPFWRQVYNIGGGEEYRKTNFQFMAEAFQAMGFSDFRKILTPRFFTSGNFHGCWYLDSDRLDKWLHFRQTPYGVFFKKLKDALPSIYKLNRLIPAELIKNWVMKPLAMKEQGPLNWIRKNRTDRIEAFWGSRQQWEKMPEKWDDFQLLRNPEPIKIDQGYNSGKEDRKLQLKDCRIAAAFRGGLCLSPRMHHGDIYSPLDWTCSCGEEFSASPFTVLRGGHWCPRCDLDSENYSRRAAANPFFAQVYR
ncbi:NAD-dependent epimerase/dehydratase family protein [Spirochaeta isovalerica]|uniref:Nucleoside-diphosphate-sugar epimerase n=1 Tax=Spirochaeta isovalerica TaxID=150 RepID=A0A841RBZ6_9SPIO|nr:NAD(P)H-binding protein [Spirochaeta isovalerica]MBB6480530.1 nucleoside-diphosphate-sugar epimerase [Spirochaeta isovalerica]